MFTGMRIILSLFMFALAFDTRASELVLNKFKNAFSVPKVYQTFAGGDEFMNRAYNDDEGKSRTDKVFYHISDTYISNDSIDHISHLLNPMNNLLGDAFEDTVIKKNGSTYAVEMEVPVAGITKSKLQYQNWIDSNQRINHRYTFSNFNMIFTGIVTQITLSKIDHGTLISIVQMSAMKGSTYSKLDKFMSVGRFEKKIKSNIRKFKEATGSIND